MGRPANRGAVNLALAAVILVAVVAALVWWMNQDEAQGTATRPNASGQQPPATPADSGENPSGNSAPDPNAGIRTGDPATLPTPAAANQDSDAAPADLPPAPQSHILTIDGEPVPLAFQKESKLPDPAAPRTEFAITVTGRVIDTGGKPVAGATVTADASVMHPAANQTPGQGAVYHVRATHSDCAITEGNPVTSDRNGDYSIHVKGWFETPVGSQHKWASFQLSARTESLAPVKSRIIGNMSKEDFPESTAGVELVVGTLASVDGRVVWADTGTAAEGASVALMRPYVSELRQDPSHFIVQATPPAPLVRQVTGEDGAFRFDGVADGEYLCWAVVPGMAHSQWRYRRGQPPEPPMQAAKVMIKDGAPVGGLRIEVFREMRVIFRTKPEIEDVPGIGMYDKRKLGQGSGRTPEEVDPRRGTTQGPLAMPDWKAVRQPDGSFAVAGLTPDHARLWVFARGYRPAMAALVPEPGRDFDAGVIELDLGHMIEGRVTDSMERPLEGAVVGVSPDWQYVDSLAPTRQFAASATTDRMGQYRITGLDKGLHHVICRLAGYQPMDAFAEPNNVTPAVVNFTLPKADAVVVGSIEWGAGGPPKFGLAERSPATRFGVTVPNTVTAVLADNPVAKRIKQGQPMPGFHATPGRIDIPVKEDWTFRAELMPGAYKFVFAHNQEVATQEQTLTSGTEAAVLFRMGQVSTLSGTVYGQNGLPLPHAKVQVYGPGRQNVMQDLSSRSGLAAEVATDGAGRYEASGLKGGKYLVWLPEYPELQHNPLRTHGSSPTVMLSLGSESTLDIRLDQGPVGAVVWLEVTANGEPCRIDFWMHGLTLDPALERGVRHPGFFVLPDGRAVATGVPAGNHRVTVQLLIPGKGHPGSSPSDVVEFTVRPGDTSVTVRHNARIAALSGKVAIPADSGLAGRDIVVQITRISTDGNGTSLGFNRIARVAADGTFTEDPFAHGRYRFEVSAKGFATSKKEVDIYGDVFVPLEMGPRSGTIVLEFGGLEDVQDAEAIEDFRSGDHGRGAEILDGAGDNALQGRNRRVDMGEFFAKGSLRIPEVAPGTVSVRLLHAMAELFETKLDVPGGGEVTLKVTFRIGPKLTLTLPASDVPANHKGYVHVFVRREGSDENFGAVVLRPQPDGSMSGTCHARAPGTFTLVSTGGTISEGTATVTLSRGSEVSHTIRLASR